MAENGSRKGGIAIIIMHKRCAFSIMCQLNIQYVYNLVKPDSWITARMIAEKHGINNNSILAYLKQAVLKEVLNIWKLWAKIVPKVLTDGQK